MTTTDLCTADGGPACTGHARLRSQLAEARDALVRVAKTLGWDTPPEQVPSGIPDLTIAVQQLRHERDQARTVLAEARQERDQLRAERDEALRAIALLEVEIRRIATVVGHHDGAQWHECTSERECMDALRRQAMPRIGGSDDQPA